MADSLSKVLLISIFLFPNATKYINNFDKKVSADTISRLRKTFDSVPGGLEFKIVILVNFEFSSHYFFNYFFSQL